MTVPLINRPYNIVSYSRTFIANIPNLPSGTEKVYYQGAEPWILKIITPEGIERIIEPNSLLEFTNDPELATKLLPEEVHDKARELSEIFKNSFTVEALNEEWCPF